MTTQTEALTLALEALEGFYDYGYDRLVCFEHITAIKKALMSLQDEAQPAVASEQPNVRTGACLLTGVCASEGHKIQKEQAPQHALMAEYWKAEYDKLKAKQWVGLTHEDIDKAIEDNQRFGGFRKVGFAYDLERVLKEKNTK